MVAMYGMGVDSMYNPHPERYERLGKMISGMPEYFAHASAEEWGSLTVDMLPALISGGAVVGRMVARVGGRIAAKIGRGVVSQIISKLSRGLAGPFFRGRIVEKLSKTGFTSFDDYWLARNPQARIDALLDQYGLRVHLGDIEVVYGGSKVGVSGGIHPTTFKTVKIYDEGLSLGNRHFVETVIEEVHHSKLMGLFPETRSPGFNTRWNSVVEPRAKAYARAYTDRLFGEIL